MLSSRDTRLVDSDSSGKIFKLPPPSHHDAHLHTAMQAKKNTISQGVPGCGKTTSQIRIYQNFPDCIVLSYNVRLKNDTIIRMQQLGIGDCQVYTFHSAAGRFYHSGCKDDQDMIKILNSRNKLDMPFIRHLVVDEAQDMIPLYFHFICKLLYDIQKKYSLLPTPPSPMDSKPEVGETFASLLPTLHIFGDENQCVFRFKGADSRYLTLADRIFPVNGDWERILLNTSYRMPKPHINFINYCLGYERIHPHKIKNNMPLYIVCNIFKDPYDLIMRCLRDYKYEDIYVIGASVRSERSPLRTIANRMSDNGIPVCKADDEEPLTDNLIKGKIVFSTPQRLKGCENKVVIYLGFDAGYFNICARNEPRCLTDALYVSISRATEQLIICHHYENDYLPFVKKSELRHLCVFKELEALAIKVPPTINPKKVAKQIAALDILRHQPTHIIQKCMDMIRIVPHTKTESRLHINTAEVLQSNGLYENLSEITAVAIQFWNEHKIAGTVFNVSMTNIDDAHVNLRPKIRVFLDNPTPVNVLILATHYCSWRSGYIYKNTQISDYNWITADELDTCHDRIETFLKPFLNSDMWYESDVTGVVWYTSDTTGDTIKQPLQGSVDILTDAGDIIELKFVDKIAPEHYLQPLIYKYLHGGNCKCYLFNIKTNVWYDVIASAEACRSIISLLVNSKFNNYYNDKSDEEFIAECMEIREKVVNNKPVTYAGDTKECHLSADDD